MASKYKNESQFQNAIVVWFSREYPHLYGSLFEVNNNPKNIKEAMFRRGMGMIAGVSDLVLIANGKFAGIELKHPATKHAKSHIEQQLKWGMHVKEQGGYYIMSESEDEIKYFIKKIVEE